MTEFDENRIAVQDTEWTRMWAKTNSIYNAIGGSFVHRDEARCNEETAMKIKEADDSRPLHASTFSAALGIPVIVSEEVPIGKLQLWRDGEMVAEYNV